MDGPHMMMKCLTGMVLAMALIAFGFVHEVRADAAFGSTGAAASWGGAANSSGASGGSNGGNSGDLGRPTCKVSEPSSIILLASALVGLVGLVVLRRRVRVK
jgi:hypothetical protein